MSELFSASGYDFDRAMAAIDASDLSALGKRAARAALTGAQDNPELLESALTRVRSLLRL